MLIRAEQLNILQTSRRAGFVDRLTIHFARLWPKQVAALGDGYRACIDREVERALAFGMDTESAAARLVNLFFVWGPDFEKKPENRWALDILLDRTLSGMAKAHQLAYRTTRELKARELAIGARA